SKRLQLNHPNAVWRAWRKSTITGNKTIAARSSPVAKSKNEIARLEDENARLRRAGEIRIDGLESEIADLKAQNAALKQENDELRRALDAGSKVSATAGADDGLDIPACLRREAAQ